MNNGVGMITDMNEDKIPAEGLGQPAVFLESVLYPAADPNQDLDVFTPAHIITVVSGERIIPVKLRPFAKFLYRHISLLSRIHPKAISKPKFSQLNPRSIPEVGPQEKQSNDHIEKTKKSSINNIHSKIRKI